MGGTTATRTATITPTPMVIRTIAPTPITTPTADTADIDAIIDAGEMTPRARALAHRIVDVIARAEAKAHGVPLDEVHFHEVGAVDSIVDIVSTAVAIDDLDIDRAIVPVLKDGHGTIRCEHGVIPVPARRRSISSKPTACRFPCAMSKASSSRPREPPSSPRSRQSASSRSGSA